VTVGSLSISTTKLLTSVTSSVLVKNLVANTTYYFEYYATNSYGITAWGGVLSFTTGTQ